MKLEKYTRYQYSFLRLTKYNKNKWLLTRGKKYNRARAKLRQVRSTYVIFVILEETLFTNKENRSDCFSTAMFPPNDRYSTQTNCRRKTSTQVKTSRLNRRRARIFWLWRRDVVQARQAIPQSGTKNFATYTVRSILYKYYQTTLKRHTGQVVVIWRFI